MLQESSAGADTLLRREPSDVLPLNVLPEQEVTMRRTLSFLVLTAAVVACQKLLSRHFQPSSRHVEVSNGPRYLR